MKRIPLTQGKFAIVDNEDYKMLMKFKWNYTHYGYARTGIGPRENHKKILMHRLLINAMPGEEVDHINQNKLDNRKVNLRIANKSLNAINSKSRKDNTSGYRGVCWDKQAKKWRSQFRFNKKKILNKLFNTPEEAYNAYSQKRRIFL